MAQLRERLTQAGLNDVRTYIQSGNVIAASNTSQAKIEQLVHDVIKENFGGDLAIIARTHTQLKTVLKKNPFSRSNNSRLYFTFFASRPEDTLLKGLLANDFSPDKIEVIGEVIYTLYATRYSDSKFNNNWFERRLKISATTRNWNTLTSLAALVEQLKNKPDSSRTQL
jgi:uncharacterized protein (DUF1697 family)